MLNIRSDYTMAERDGKLSQLLYEMVILIFLFFT